MASPRDPDLVLVLQRVQGHGRTVHARISTARSACYACNEIKLLVKEFGTDEPPVTGTLALQDVRRRSQNNEEDR